MLTVEQALAVIGRLQSAAPPATAARLAEVAELIETLDHGMRFGDDIWGIAAQPEPETKPEPETDSITLSETDELFVLFDDAIRHPLAQVRESANLLRADAFARLTRDQQELLQVVAASADCAVSLLESVEHLIALKHGLLEVNPLIFSCALLMREAHDRMLPLAQARAHRLTLRLPANTLQAQGDYQRVLVILDDMLDNAIHYTPDGGEIHVTAEHLGSHVLISVADNGIGLSPEDLENIGQPFWRATHQELVRRHSGGGLRLHLAREVLALQGGEFIFSGEPGVGSTFSFTLPVAPPEMNAL